MFTDAIEVRNDQVTNRHDLAYCLTVKLTRQGSSVQGIKHAGSTSWFAQRLVAIPALSP